MAQSPRPHGNTALPPYADAPHAARPRVDQACALLYDPLALTQQARDALAYAATAQSREPAHNLNDLHRYADEIAGACRALGSLTAALADQLQHCEDAASQRAGTLAEALAALQHHLQRAGEAARADREELDAPHRRG